MLLIIKVALQVFIQSGFDQCLLETKLFTNNTKDLYGDRNNNIQYIKLLKMRWSSNKITHIQFTQLSIIGIKNWALKKPDIIMNMQPI